MKRVNYLSVYAVEHPLSTETIPELMQLLDAEKYLVMCSLVPRPTPVINLGLIVPSVRSGITGGSGISQKIQPQFEHIYGLYWLYNAF
jgi:hypothetical protein